MKELELSHKEAREITEQIKQGLQDVWQLLLKAWKSRVWKPLGYKSWDEYCFGEFKRYRIQLPKEERLELVTSYRKEGMSTRNIGSALGIGKTTVHRDLATVPSGTDGRITGEDGRSRPAYSTKPDKIDDEIEIIANGGRMPTMEDFESKVEVAYGLSEGLKEEGLRRYAIDRYLRKSEELAQIAIRITDFGMIGAEDEIAWITDANKTLSDVVFSTASCLTINVKGLSQ